jgi:molybdopterin-guanine dinucleotide biosynthesis protein B
MQNASIPILGFAARSGTGKTTLLTQLIPLLKQHHVRIGLIKHSHHNFEIDQPGKDSYQLRKAGASSVMLVSSHRRAIINEFESPIEPQLAQQLPAFESLAIDLILVEGFKKALIPKIELYRQHLNQAFLYPHDPNIIALASDVALKLPRSITPLALNNPTMIANFIIQRFLA